MNKEQKIEVVCQVCCIKGPGLSYYYAQCDHTGFCKKCCQTHFEDRVWRNKRVPKCMESNCSAALRDEGKNCMLHFFSQKHQNMWRQFKKTLKKGIPCQVPNCPGVVKAGKCLICDKYYCEKCNQQEHPGVKCLYQKKQELKIDDENIAVKKCPQCHILINRIGGCYKITCTKCDYEFCFECLKKWEEGHQNQHGSQGKRAHIWGGITQFFCCLNTRSRRKRK